MRSFLILFALFLIYSFLGWLCETVFCSIAARRFINRGFLSGPFCPIYGFGAIIILVFFSGLRENLILLFIGSMIGTSALEYLTSLLLEKLFHLSLWDYSNRPWNLNGRICLRNSLLFGIMSVLMIRFIHPHMTKMLSSLPELFLISALAVLAAGFLVDASLTIHALAEIHLAAHDRQMELEGLAALRDQYLQNAKEERRRKHIHRLQAFYRRLGKAFPRMKSLRHPDTFRELLLDAQKRTGSAEKRIKSHKKDLK